MSKDTNVDPYSWMILVFNKENTSVKWVCFRCDIPSEIWEASTPVSMLRTSFSKHLDSRHVFLKSEVSDWPDSWEEWS